MAMGKIAPIGREGIGSLRCRSRVPTPKTVVRRFPLQAERRIPRKRLTAEGPIAITYSATAP